MNVGNDLVIVIVAEGASPAEVYEIVLPGTFITDKSKSVNVGADVNANTGRLMPDGIVNVPGSVTVLLVIESVPIAVPIVG